MLQFLLVFWDSALESDDLPFVEIGIVDMHPLWRNSDDGTILLMKFGHLFWHNSITESIIPDVIAIGELGNERSRDVSEGMEKESVKEQTRKVSG
jgi:hypothetical protein